MAAGHLVKTKLALSTSWSAVQTVPTGSAYLKIVLDDVTIAFDVQTSDNGDDPGASDPIESRPAGARFVDLYAGRMGGQDIRFRIRSASGTPNATVTTMG